MRKINDDLWQSARYSSGSLNTYAYLLIRETGNVLFYNTADSSDLDNIDTLGGISYQLLTHRDESGSSLQRIKERFCSRLGCSSLEAPYIARDCNADLVFDTSITNIDDIQIIHTPGHTDGSICYLYESPFGLTYLFTGDSFFLWEGHWRTFVINRSGGSMRDMIKSLEKLRNLSPDIVMSSGFVGKEGHREVSKNEWTSAIEQEIQELLHQSTSE